MPTITVADNNYSCYIKVIERYCHNKFAFLSLLYNVRYETKYEMVAIFNQNSTTVEI